MNLFYLDASAWVKRHQMESGNSIARQKTGYSIPFVLGTS